MLWFVSTILFFENSKKERKSENTANIREEYRL